MATHDYVISNASGAAVRADLNNALAAIVSNNSNATEPSTTYAYQWWADIGSSPAVMKLRNAANDGWITLFQLDGEWSTIALENGTDAAPSLYFKDSGTDTGFFSGGTDQVNITTGGTERVEWGTSEVVFNDGGENYDFRVEGDTEANLIFVDASADTVSFRDDVYIDGSGRLLVGTSSSGTYSGVLEVKGNNVFTTAFYNGAGHLLQLWGTASASTGWNATDSVTYVNKHSTNSRSINAAGTVNASGADYAEYMVKTGDFTIAKGAVCGVTADGLLTLDYSDAVSFAVKSTNPSYVGGDTWGTEDVIGPKPNADDTEALAQWEADLEAARQQVDRIAFAGRVPVNVMGATPGQYIVPVEAADGGIEGIAKNEADLTLAEYMRAVGKVIAIEDDGRARIIVKVA